MITQRFRVNDVVYIPEYDEIALVIDKYDSIWGCLYRSIIGEFYAPDQLLEIIKIGEL